MFDSAGQVKVDLLTTDGSRAHLGPTDKIATLRPMTKMDHDLLSELARGTNEQQERAQTLETTKAESQYLLDLETKKPSQNVAARLVDSELARHAGRRAKAQETRKGSDAQSDGD